jgi:hypothetical protein
MVVQHQLLFDVSALPPTRWGAGIKAKKIDVTAHVLLAIIEKGRKTGRRRAGALTAPGHLL